MMDAIKPRTRLEAEIRRKAHVLRMSIWRIGAALKRSWPLPLYRIRRIVRGSGTLPARRRSGDGR